MADIDIKKLLEAGAHFGHKAERWHPKMAPYIHSKRGGSHIIDLTKTVEKLEDALRFIEETTSKNKQVLFVATKRQAADIVKKLAEETNQPYVTERWLGGMLTNWNTIGAQIKHLVSQEAKMASGELAGKFNKLEVQRFQEEIDGMNVLYGGIKELSSKPGAVVIFDVVHDKNAVKEAQKLNLPIVGVCDTNANPTGINFPIPCNDDAIKTIQLLADYMKAAVMAGKAKTKAEKPADKDEK
ncbi:30S ribosomal protein S2 [Candidatus Saccharibacteria bacterium]|nr:MAG: 30S ribosomal protein S2 [Candidatus Saccharibacteria bacterium]PID99603.1 MAG: 30S ribosomal protein S2 [Candidatus Saccharibacteria bacterium]